MVTAREFGIFTEVTTHKTTGLKANWKQFTLLVIINAFVGGMVGMERTLLPEIAQHDFQISAYSAMLSFIVVFGTVKALSNYLTGSLANRMGRKRLLILGWLVGIPIPFLLMYGPTWNWILVANVLLGINQGLAWSSTVVMKIDLVDEKQRGLAMGLNEFAGYLSVAVLAYLSTVIAQAYGLRPFPFIIGIVLSIGGIILSWVFVKDTQHMVQTEAVNHPQPRLTNIFRETTWTHRILGTVTQAGLVNNLNDGMVWGIFPLLLANQGFSLEMIGIITGIYPAVWGISQIGTGALGDYWSKKALLFWGMLVQGLTLFGLLIANNTLHFMLLSACLGLGTALVYPTFLSKIAQHTHPLDRAKSIGTFRLWRDLGYAFGALLTGILADWFNLHIAIAFIGGLTVLSAGIIAVRMP
ncbi:MAG: MFS transporter, partial [Flavobacteriales bacterium]